MCKIFFSSIFCVFVLLQECIGMNSPFSTKTKNHYPLPFILKRGEYQFPQKLYPDTPEQRKTNSDGEKLTLFCPAVTNRTKNFDEYCLTPLEETVSSCQKQVKPVLVKSKELEIRCGIYGESIYYDFVFRLCTQYENAERSKDEISSTEVVDHLMYRICYNVKKKETIFTYHRILSPNLLAQEFSLSERAITYDLSTANYDLPKNTFNHMKTAFSNLNGTFVKRFKKGEEQFNEIKKLLLVSPDHMVYSSWKIPLYHFINVKPAWDFTIQAWNAINSFLEDTMEDTEFIQISGTKEVWESNGKIVYLDDSQTITIPKYFWKLVYLPESKKLLLIILHNIPDSQSTLPKLCEANTYKNIHESTSTSPSYVYYCDPNIIIDLYNLPEELDMLQKTAYFSPLVMSYFNGVYSFPQVFYEYKPILNIDNHVLFCPPAMGETKIYEESCLIRNENENPYCMKPVKSVVPPKLQMLEPECAINSEDSSRINSQGFRLCFKPDEIFNTKNQTTKKEEYFVEILNICNAMGATITFHKMISPQLLFNKNLDNEGSIDYSLRHPLIKKTEDDFKIVKTVYTPTKGYVSSDGETLKSYPIASPNDMAFSTWKNAAYTAWNFEFTWNKIEKIWNIINRQIEIQAADENIEFIQINGSLGKKLLDDIKPKFTYTFHTYLWKVVYTPDMKKNIAIIVHNEKDKTKIGEKLCEESTCNMSQWNFGSVSDLEDFAYCCDAEVITEKFKLPKALWELKIQNYHLPLLIKQDENDDFLFSDTYNGYHNLNENQILFCPSEEQQQLEYDERSSFPQKKEIPYCKYPVKPFLISAGTIDNYCGGDEDAHEFTFNYKINVKSRINKKDKTNYYLDVYVACFNRKNQETLYTFHSIKSTALLRNPKLEDERQMSFKLSSNGSNLTLLEFKKLEKNLYNRLYNFPDFEKHHYAVPLLLVSPDDMGFAVWKKTAYHYINTKPSFENVVELWNSINTHIRNLAMNETFTYAQSNGFIDYLKINDEMIVLKDCKTGMPNAFWKIVHSLDQLGFKNIVIIVHNVPNEKYISKKYCNVNMCKYKPWLSFLAPKNKMVYCCDAAEIKARFRLERN